MEDITPRKSEKTRAFLKVGLQAAHNRLIVQLSIALSLSWAIFTKIM